jgi:hypothetical protein
MLEANCLSHPIQQLGRFRAGRKRACHYVVF